jgi:hypothetical protein
MKDETGTFWDILNSQVFVDRRFGPSSPLLLNIQCNHLRIIEKEGLRLPSRLDRPYGTIDNDGMLLPGRVKNGVVQFEGGASLPEGTPVTVSWGARVWHKPGKKNA